MPARNSVTITVPPALDKLPQRLEQGQARFLKLAAQGMAAELGRVGPGRIGKSFTGELVAPDTAVVVSHHPGAKAQDVGAYIAPRKGRAGRGNRRPVIRFNVGVGGETVYRPFSRIPAQHYVRKAMRARRRVVDIAFKRTFGDL